MRKEEGAGVRKGKILKIKTFDQVTQFLNETELVSVSVRVPRFDHTQVPGGGKNQKIVALSSSSHFPFSLPTNSFCRISSWTL